MMPKEQNIFVTLYDRQFENYVLFEKEKSLSTPLLQLIEKCRQSQEEYLIVKNQEPVQLSLFKLDLARAEKEATKIKDATP